MTPLLRVFHNHLLLLQPTARVGGVQSPATSPKEVPRVLPAASAAALGSEQRNEHPVLEGGREHYLMSTGDTEIFFFFLAEPLVFF